MKDSARPLAPINLAEPRIEQRGPLLIAGLRVHLDENAANAIPQLWQKFLPYFGHLPQQVNCQAFGLCLHKTANAWDFDYLAGCAVWDDDNLPSALSTLILPEQQYAIFTHDGHVSQLRATVDAIFARWLPTSQYRQLNGDKNFLHFLEFYGEQFDSATGLGDIAVWLPVVRI